jgi:hypothetical protein
MKSFQFPIRFRLVLIACAAIVLGVNVSSAQVSRGEFTLPVQTHWGAAVLTPGTYSYTLDAQTSALPCLFEDRTSHSRSPRMAQFRLGFRQWQHCFIPIGDQQSVSHHRRRPD